MASHVNTKFEVLMTFILNICAIATWKNLPWLAISALMCGKSLLSKFSSSGIISVSNDVSDCLKCPNG